MEAHDVGNLACLVYLCLWSSDVRRENYARFANVDDLRTFFAAHSLRLIYNIVLLFDQYIGRAAGRYLA